MRYFCRVAIVLSSYPLVGMIGLLAVYEVFHGNFFTAVMLAGLWLLTEHVVYKILTKLLNAT